MNEILFKTLILSADAALKVDEIHIQLSALQRQCSYRDRPLCDTLKVKSFDEMGFIEKLKIVSDFEKKEISTFESFFSSTKTKFSESFVRCLMNIKRTTTA